MEFGKCARVTRLGVRAIAIAASPPHRRQGTWGGGGGDARVLCAGDAQRAFSFSHILSNPSWAASTEAYVRTWGDASPSPASPSVPAVRPSVRSRTHVFLVRHGWGGSSSPSPAYRVLYHDRVLRVYRRQSLAGTRDTRLILLNPGPGPGPGHLGARRTRTNEQNATPQ